MRTADLNAPFAFLDEFRALPMLSSLSVETLPIPEPGRAEHEESLRHYACIPDGLSLPRLEDLSVSARFVVLAPSQRFPAVRTLAFEPTQHLEAELRLALEVCPNVSQLTLNLGSVSSGAQQVPDDPKWWLERAPRSLRAVTVTGVPEACGRWIRAVFPPALPSLCLEYSSPRALATGGSILCDLGPDIHLSVSQTAGVLSVRGVDPGGVRTRSISVCVQYQLPIDVLLAIFTGGLSGHWQRVTAISADASLWPLLVALFPSTGAAMRIKTLCLAIGRRVRTPASSQGLPQRLVVRPQQFAAVRSLTLAWGPHAGSMTPGDIHAVVRSLHLTLPLATLEIDRRLCAGDATQFEDLADSVSLGVYTACQ